MKFEHAVGGTRWRSDRLGVRVIVATSGIQASRKSWRDCWAVLAPRKANSPSQVEEITAMAARTAKATNRLPWRSICWASWIEMSMPTAL
jgi:hypothetical protein